MEKTMAYRLVGEISLLVHSTRAPSDHEYDGYLEFIATLPPQIRRSMVVTPGPGPNARQRAKTNEVLKARKQMDAKVAVVTDSTMVRGIVTALSWFNREIRVFSMAKIHDALRYLNANPEEASRLLIQLRMMQAELET